MSERFDIAILGFGKAGKTIAAKLASKGKKVVLVEKDTNMYGGTCINVGCIPSKRLVTEAELAPKSDVDAQKSYYHEAILGKRNLTSALRAANYNKLVSAGVTVLDGVGAFTSATDIVVTAGDGTKQTITAEKFIINTGAEPVMPKIPGLENNPYIYVSESLLDLDVLPERLTIIGGGYIGLEFASMYANFGSKVTILQIEDAFLPREDTDIADNIESVLARLINTARPYIAVMISSRDIVRRHI